MAGTQNPATQSTIEALRNRIGRELGSLNLKEAADRHRARVVFIESVLSWEFGDQLLNDQRLGALVRDIEESVESHPQAAAALDNMLMQLHSGAR